MSARINILRKVTGGILLGLAMMIGQSALAQAPAKKYAVVDMQSVIVTVSEGKAAKKALEAEIKEKEKELMKQKKELEDLNKNWQQQAPMLSEEARMKKQQEFQEKIMNLRNQEMSFQGEIKQKEQRATQKIAMAVTALVDKIAKERGFEMVFETSSAGLLYLKDPEDLTKEVIDTYEKQSKSAKK
jgi:outer membrane protein